MLTVDDTHLFLFERGLLTPDAAIDGELTITSTPRKNRNLRVTSGRGDLLIKQFEEARGSDGYVSREALFYRYCAAEPGLAAVRALLPRLVHAEEQGAVIVLQLLRDALPLWRYYETRTAARFPVKTAAAVGQALATLHAAFADPAILDDPRLAPFRGGAPWIMNVHQPSPQVLAGISGANYQALRILQNDDKLAAGLDAMRALWEPSTLIHFDVKLDNVLVDEQGVDDDGGTSNVYLIDWELAQLGDPAWDVGSALQDFLGWWIVTMPHEKGLEEMTAEARFPLAAMQPAIRALWSAYRDKRGLSGAESARFLERAIVFCGARLIQSAHEIGNNFNVLAAPSVLMLQLAANLLADADRARQSLFTLEAEGAVQ
jgi:Ser/Thr protein kinase RdoA (MazF antagonist)